MATATEGARAARVGARASLREVRLVGPAPGRPAWSAGQRVEQGGRHYEVEPDGPSRRGGGYAHLRPLD